MLRAMLVKETPTHFCREGGFEKLRNRSNYTQKVDHIRADLGHGTLPTPFLPTILVWFWPSYAYKSPLLQKKGELWKKSSLHVAAVSARYHRIVAGPLKLPQPPQCCLLSGEEEEVAVPEIPLPQGGWQAG